MRTAAQIAAAQRRVATDLTEVFMDEILGKAQRLAPLEEGTLAGSADRETIDSGGMVTVIGSFSTPYARRQHEELTWQHLPGRQAKYLEQPFKEAVPAYPAALARALRTVR